MNDDDLDYSTPGRRAAICAIVVTIGLGLMLLTAIVTADRAGATGDHGNFCYNNPTHPKCVDPEPTCETDPALCEPEPCAENEVRNEAGECVPVVVEPPVDPPVVTPPVVEPELGGQAIPRDPPLPAIDQGKKRGETTTVVCGTERTVHADGTVTYKPLGVPENTCEETG